MAIRSDLKHREKIPYGYLSAYERGEKIDRYILEELAMKAPKTDKVKRIKKTVNLINRDDSALTIAYHTFRIISKYHPDRHQVMITFMEWTTGNHASHKELMKFLFKDYDPFWQLQVEHSGEVVTVKFTFPGMDWLVFG